MADPTSYSSSYSFTGYQAANPSKPLPAAQVDNELANVATATDGIVAALQDIRRSDGKLKNGLVTADALDADLTASFSGGAISAWAGVVDYAAGIAAQIAAPATVVVYSGETYVCVEDHTTASTFQPTKWKKIAEKGAAGIGAGDMLAANNLLDVDDAAQARTNLGLGSLATKSAVGAAEITDGSVGTSELADGAATVAKMAFGTLTAVASASTVDLGAQASRNLVITGTTTITSFGASAVADNAVFTLRFAGALTLTNGASLILLGGANITTAADDMAQFVCDATGTWRMANYSRAANSTAVLKTGTSAGDVPVLDSGGKFATGNLPTGSVIGSSYTEYATYTTITTSIPFDDTIPQISEGDQIFNVSYTPKRADTRLIIEFHAIVGNSGGQTIAAMFVNAGANAVQVTSSGSIPNNANVDSIGMIYAYAPGVATAQSIAVRVGPAAGQTAYINGSGAARKYGGAAKSTLVIREVLP